VSKRDYSFIVYSPILSVEITDTNRVYLSIIDKCINVDSDSDMGIVGFTANCG
jgi:hypothetical protein